MNTHPLHFTTTGSHPHRVNLSSPSAVSSSEISFEEDDTPSRQLNCRHSHQLNQISPARVSYSAEEKRDELRPETTRENLVKSKSETTVDEKLEYAKMSLGFVFPMLVSLVVSASEITKTTGARTAAVALSFAPAFMVSGLLLRKTYPKISSACLICGAILAILSVYSLVFSSLPSHLKIILVLCGVVPLMALVLLSWAYFRRENKMKDPEVGEAGVVDEEEERIMNEFLANPGGIRAVGEAGVVDEEEERIMNWFLASGMFFLDEAEFMKKEIVMNIIPESGASSSLSLSSLHSRADQQSIGHLSEGPGRRLVAIGNSVHNSQGPIKGQC